MYILKVTLYFTIVVRASKNLHNSMFSSILSTHIRFFDLNPLGRIINRFSKDIGQIDDTIPQTCLDFGHVKFYIINIFIIIFFYLWYLLILYFRSNNKVTVLVLSCLGISIFLNFWIIVPMIPLTIVFIFIRKYFLASSVEIKRIDGISRINFFFINSR